MAGYPDIEAMQEYWTEQGYVIPEGTSEAAISAAWNRGAAVIDRYEDKFSGRRTDWEQDHAWPRTGASTYYGDAIPSDKVPGNVAKASWEAAWLELNNPGSLSPVVTASQSVKREKVGSLEIEYQSTSSSASVDDLVAMAKPVVMIIEDLLFLFCAPVLPGVLVV